MSEDFIPEGFTILLTRVDLDTILRVVPYALLTNNLISDDDVEAVLQIFRKLRV
jgi:hypothetical protein